MRFWKSLIIALCIMACIGCSAFATEYSFTAADILADTEYLETLGHNDPITLYGEETAMALYADYLVSKGVNPYVAETEVVEEDDPLTCVEPEAVTDTDVEPVSDLPTVNISDESVQAIADAVTFNSTLSVSNKDGVVFDVPSEVSAYWNDYTYKAYVIAGSTTAMWYLSNTEFSARIGGSYLMITGNGASFFYRNGVFEDNVYSNLSGNYGNQWNRFVSIQWSNFDILDENGAIYYSSDYRLYYDVFFDTGYDDLTVDSQTSDNLQLPTLKKAGYSFLGWYLDAEYTTPYTADYVFTSDTTLYAKWTEEPAMAVFHNTIFAALIEMFNCEAIVYMFALTGLACIFAIGKRLIFV